MGLFSNSGGLRDSGSPSHSFLFSFSRTPGEEFFYYSGVLREACHNGIVLNCQDAVGPSANGNDCWELVEFNGPISVARDLEGGHLSMNSKKEGGKGLLNGKKVA